MTDQPRVASSDPAATDASIYPSHENESWQNHPA
jgi:hypothetical protein